MPHIITSQCDGCSACLRQCPTRAITGTFKQRFTIDPELCIDCSVCGTVCARGSVVNQRGEVVAHVPRPDRPHPVVDPSLCNACGRCLDICPFGCRSVAGRAYFGVSFLLHPVRCASCSECANICIKGAISMEKIDLRRYDAQAEGGRLENLLGRDST